VLNSRETASLIWVGVALVMLLVMAARDSELRGHLAGAVRAFFVPVLVSGFLIFYGYLALIIVVAERVNLWEPALLSETVIWLAVAGVAMLWGLDKAADEPHYFRRSVRRIFVGTLLVEFFFELATFPLWLELVIQPILLMLILMEVLTEQDPEHEPARGCVGNVLAVLGFAFLAGTIYLLVRDWSSVDWPQQGKLLGMLVWLPIAALPVIFLFAWLMAFGSLTSLVERRSSGDRRHVELGVRLGMAFGFAWDLYALGQARPLAYELGRASGFAAARHLVREFRTTLARDAV
jgi:hypothetical protein